MAKVAKEKVEKKAAKASNLKPLHDPSDFVALWRQGGRVTLEGYDFAGLVVSGQNLPAADVRGCSFTGARFIKCLMQGWIVRDCEGRPLLDDCDTRFSDGL